MTKMMTTLMSVTTIKTPEWNWEKILIWKKKVGIVFHGTREGGNIKITVHVEWGKVSSYIKKKEFLKTAFINKKNGFHIIDLGQKRLDFLIQKKL